MINKIHNYKTNEEIFKCLNLLKIYLLCFYYLMHSASISAVVNLSNIFTVFFTTLICGYFLYLYILNINYNNNKKYL